MLVEGLLSLLKSSKLLVSLRTATEVGKHNSVPPRDQVACKTFWRIHNRLQVRTFQGKCIILHLIDKGTARRDFIVLEVVVQDVTEQRLWLNPSKQGLENGFKDLYCTSNRG